MEMIDGMNESHGGGELFRRYRAAEMLPPALCAEKGSQASAIRSVRLPRIFCGAKSGYSSGMPARLIHRPRKPTETLAITSQRFDDTKVTSAGKQPNLSVTRA